MGVEMGGPRCDEDMEGRIKALAPRTLDLYKILV